MKPRAVRPGVRQWFRRGLAAALGALLLLATLGTLPPSAHTVAQADADSAVTVQGPPVWQPATGDYGPPGSITVNQTTNLTDQVVHVAWTGFTPASTTTGNAVPNYIAPLDSGVLYPVRVYQCRGLHPFLTDCYGSSVYGGKASDGFQQPVPPAGTATPEFPSNRAVALTHPDGTGAADIEVWTAQQSQTLGCDPSHPCSLVVEPNYGGDALDYGPLLGTAGGCDDHSEDLGAAGVNEATDTVVNYQDINGEQAGEQCAWKNHVVIPLSFAPTPENCAAKNADFKVQGLEMANRAVTQWSTGACLGTAPVNVQYTFGGGEPQARAAFLARSSNLDVALTAYPDTAPAPRPYVYAPLAATGISVTFVLDDPSGRQIRQMRLNARLLAKMLTQSYTLTPAVTVQANPAGFASVAGNPMCIFDDPEFKQLNPSDPQNGTTWPACDTLEPGNGVAPVVVGGTTDLVRQITSWIAADPDAQNFLKGTPDPWGMHVDSFYRQPGFAGYPVDAFIPQDGTGTVDSSVGEGKPVVFHYKQEEWNPIVGGLGQVARSALEAQPTCYSVVFDSTAAPLITKCPAEAVGTRAVFAIMDSGQAKAFALPEAQLENAAGSFVGPTTAGMQAAVQDMPVDAKTGTQLLPYAAADTTYSKDTAAYPLTTVQYAMLPTQGLSATKATKIAQFVREVTDPGIGQVYGSGPGQLAPGFVDLSSSQLAQAQAAVQHVAAQDRTLPTGQVAPTPPAKTPSATSKTPAGAGTPGNIGSAGGTGGGTGSPPSGSTATNGPRPSSSNSALHVLSVAAGTPNPDQAGLQRLLLPGLLVAGALLLVGGPLALLLGGTEASGRLRRGLGGAAAAAGRRRRSLTNRLGGRGARQ